MSSAYCESLMKTYLQVFLCCFTVPHLYGCSDWELTELKEQSSLQAALSVDPPVLDYGALEPGATQTLSFTLYSEGDVTAHVSAITLQGASAFEVIWDGEGAIPVGESKEILVTYTASSPVDTAFAVVENDGIEPSLSVELIGVGLYPAIATIPESVSLVSENGENVSTDVLIQSVGSAPLEIYDHWLQGDRFTIDGNIPEILQPGESTSVTVTYDPDDAFDDYGKLWLSTNTESGTSVVPLEGSVKTPCVGLSEAWDIGLLSIRGDVEGRIILNHLGGEDDSDICIDQWYVLLSESSQDAGFGDPYYDPGGEYPFGTLTMHPGDSLYFYYGSFDQPAWWCMEQTQYTQPTTNFTFMGARVPRPLLTRMLDMDQEGLWQWMAQNPVVIVGRDTHYIAPRQGDNQVVLRALNMGAYPTTTTITETVSPEFYAYNFSVPPQSLFMEDDGSVTYTFELYLGGTVLTDVDIHTIYSEEIITYTLEPVADCQGRYTGVSPTASWIDASGTTQVSDASPLIIDCQ